MSGLELLIWLAVAYGVGRIQQHRRDRKTNEVGHHLGKAYDAMRKRERGDKK